jgi:Pyruvate/2-oxoacid:ferredoxin oxidoreductase gamma subunit
VNIVLLAAAVKAGFLDMTAEDLKNAIRCRVDPKFHEMNMLAVDLA